MSVRVGYFLFALLAVKAWALVPVEGIIMGEAREDIQHDPLAFVFRDFYDRSHSAENKKVKLYHSTYLSGAYLLESCNFYGPMSYANTWREKQARRTVAATLQYLGLDTTIKAIGAYAKKLDVGSTEYKRLATNLVKNYCSQNLSVFSLRKIESSLLHYYENPEAGIVPTVESSPFATMDFKNRTEKTQARSTELDYAVRSFRSFCSWGGEVEDYRLLGPYLKNPFIMAFVIKNLLGVQDTYLAKEEKVGTIPSKSTVQVSCEDLICRKSSKEEFEEKFPLSVGASGLNTDLAKLYCNHYRFQDYSSANAIPQVKKWIKESELEDPVFETSFFLSLMTGVPDPLFSTEKYVELPFIVKSTIDERWNAWAREVLTVFSKDMLFEESLKVKTMPRRSSFDLKLEGLGLRFSVTLGEMDRIMDETDKLRAQFTLRFSKNYLRSLRVKWKELVNEADYEGQKNMKKDIAQYVGLQLKNKEKLFLQKMWNQDLARLMADELLEQALAYNGPLFDSLKDQMINVPVEFNYGLFAMSYLRFRADVNADRLKIRF